jgi:hypothetical protein
VFRDLLAALAALVGLVTAAFPLTRARRRRAAIKTDLDILVLLPAGTEAHRQLSDHVEHAVLSAIRDAEARRDWPGIVYVAVATPLGAIFAFAGDGVWALVGALTLALGLMIAVFSFPRFVRDANGIPLWMLRSSRDGSEG